MARAADIAQTVTRLVQIERFEAALPLLLRGIDGVARLSDWQDLLSAFDVVPGGFLLQEPRWATAYTRVLAGARRVSDLLDFSGSFLSTIPAPADRAEVLADRGWALLMSARWQAACECLEQALLHLQDTRLGMTWWRLGLAYFRLEGGQWETAFGRARPLLSGRLLGLCLNDEAACWQIGGQGDRARTLWLNALPYLKKDPYFLAWVYYNLGDSALRDSQAEAEHYFLETERLTRSKAARAFRSRALHGLGTLHRTRGEWPRAEAAYTQAIKHAAEPDDGWVAHWSLSRTYRLMGQLGKAARAVRQAIDASGGALQAMYLEEAAILLASKDIPGAKKSISLCPNPEGLQRVFATVLEAEIARISGEPHEAVKLLSNRPLQGLLVQEEMKAWPELFALLDQANINRPTPLEYAETLVVKVQTLGKLRVTVNGREVAIGPTSRAGELLVLLLENRGKASNLYLTRCLWPGSDPKQKRQALWQLVQEVRSLLGWPSSVQALFRAFRLDPKARWLYDLEHARSAGWAGSRFLEGVNSMWVEEVNNELTQLAARRQPPI